MSRTTFLYWSNLLHVCKHNLYLVFCFNCLNGLPYIRNEVEMISSLKEYGKAKKKKKKPFPENVCTASSFLCG